jgi:spermidine synthase
MNYLLIPTILIVGLSGIVAQVLILRELLVSFYGNELTLGLILSNWVISEALGVFIIGKYAERVKNRIGLFIILETIFSLFFLAAIYLSRTFKDIIGIPFGEGVGLPIIFFSSLFIIFPVSFCHGALFSLGCKIYSLSVKEEPGAIGKVYAWETLGTIIGGVITTYFFITLLKSFQIALIIFILNFIICLLLIKSMPKPRLRYSVIFTAALVFCLFLSGNLNKIHELSINKQFRPGKVLAYRNSVYGNLTVTQQEQQYTFFYNGIPVITTPYPDITFVQDFGHLPLLFHKAPCDILVISAGVGGLINEILKHPISKLDYAELDPLIINLVKKYPTGLTNSELTDKRVNIINLDGRFFIRTTGNQYDLILIGLSKPSDLSSNRLFTQEFFTLAKDRLRADGILAFWLPGSLTYLSQELKDLNACISNGLKNTYKYVRVIPGDYNIFLASSSQDILKIDSRLIAQRIKEQNIKSNLLIPSYLDYRLDGRSLDWFKLSLEGSTKKVNQDFLPLAVFKMLMILNKQFSPLLAKYLEMAEKLDLKRIAIFIFTVTLLLFYIFNRKSARLAKLSIAYSIATTGFFGMTASLILIFSFQIFYGYLYYKIGLLVSIFMAGIASGSILTTHGLKKIKNVLRLLIWLEVIVLVFAYLLAWLITKGAGLFFILFFISGMLMGLEFPLASKIYLAKRGRIGEVAGLLYGADLLGGWVAGLFGGILFLPILGLFKTCLVMLMLKLSSAFLLIIFRKRLSD